MAYTRKTNNTKPEWKPVNNMIGWTVIGTRDRFSISFEPFEGMRMGFNGCRIVTGKNGDFISFPAWKDKSNNYHDYCYITFSEEEITNIIETIG